MIGKKYQEISPISQMEVSHGAVSRNRVPFTTAVDDLGGVK